MDTQFRNNTILSVSDISKSYDDFSAVKNLSFNVDKGEIFGFLGPNGAGKTTTINMICGLIKPDKGQIVINSIPVNDKNRNSLQSVGMCPQEIVIWEMLTCMEQLEFTGSIYNLPKERVKKKSLELLTDMGLLEKKDKLAKTLSGGMQRRLNIALALIHEPQILILDEPQAGLDPQSRVLVRDFIRSLARKTTVILTTHDMDEADRLSDRVAIIDRGELLVLDTPDKLKNVSGPDEILEIMLSNDGAKKLPEVLSQFPKAIKNITRLDCILTITSMDIMSVMPEILQVLKQNCLKIEDMKLRKKTLEDVFISLTGRGLRE